MGGGKKSQSSSSRNNAAGRPYGNKGMRNRGGKNGVFCYCGLRTVMKHSTTAENPGRPFYGCPNYEYGIHCNFFRWADGCEDQVSAAPIPLEVLHELSWRMTTLESDVRTVKMMTMMLLAFVVTFGVCLGFSLLGFIFNK
ncbi:uncharacterized protein LOC110274843 [Arachis duranensis]|uniref:Uncharacterized protein LOC110274843 n=1 Tax=Arachis duranensis TaxID=130453 RepID=A0A6P5MSM9_ARADU|nr:uncharacterized protein LOC110274843 [Arachis duranensis]